jgi:mono/diheme cytochrome c family protein
MKMRNLAFFLASLFLGAVLMSFVTSQDQKKGAPWVIPAEYKSKKNPVKGDASLEKLGKAAWAKHCRSCHGNMGLGDGPKAASLKTFPGNFKDAKFQALTDGEIYYQSFVGRDEMPNFEKKIIDEEERWAVVNLIRTMK